MFKSSLLTYFTLYFCLMITQTHINNNKGKKRRARTHKHPHPHPHPKYLFNRAHTHTHAHTLSPTLTLGHTYIHDPLYTTRLFFFLFLFGPRMVVAATPDFDMNNLTLPPSTCQTLPGCILLAMTKSTKRNNTHPRVLLLLLFSSLLLSPFLPSSLYHPSLLVTNSIGSCSRYNLVCHHWVSTEQTT